MKNLINQYGFILLLISTLIICSTINLNAQVSFRTGETVNYNDTTKQDLIIAGGEVNINSKVDGDVILAGGEIKINEKVNDDLMIGGGQIYVNGPVGDDIRIFGGEIEISEPVDGDVIIFGGQVDIKENAIIKGDLVLFCGDANVYSIINGNATIKSGEFKLDGTVNGDLTAKGGEVNINGIVKGKSTLSADNLYVGDNALFGSDVTYWTERGEIDFKNAANGITTTYDESLSISSFNEDQSEKKKSKGTFGALGFGIFSFIAMALVILLLTIFNKFFAGASLQVKNDFMSSFGWGILLMIVLPVLSLFLLITIIGIPLGLIGLALAAIAMLISSALASIIIANYINKQYNKNWSGTILYFVALGIYFVFKLLGLIPFLGWLIVFCLVAVAFGSVILEWRSKRVRTLV